MLHTRLKSPLQLPLKFFVALFLHCRQCILELSLSLVVVLLDHGVFAQLCISNTQLLLRQLPMLHPVLRVSNPDPPIKISLIKFSLQRQHSCQSKANFDDIHLISIRLADYFIGLRVHPFSLLVSLGLHINFTE